MQQSNARPLSYILYILSALERARSEQPAAPRAFLGRHVPRREKPDTARGFATPMCRSRSASVRPRPAGEREGGGPARRRREEGGGRRRPVARAGEGEGCPARRGSEERGRWGGRPLLLLLLRGPTPLEARRRCSTKPTTARGFGRRGCLGRYSPHRPDLLMSTSAAAAGEDWPPGAGAGWWRGPAPATAEPRSGRRSHARLRADPTSARNRE